MANLKFRPGARAKLRKLGKFQSNTELATIIGVDKTTVHRVLGGVTNPSNRFIAGVVNAFGSECFGDVFESVPDKRPL